MKKYIAFVILFAAISATAFSQTLKEAFRLTDNEQFEPAREAYQQLIAKEPGNGTYFYYLGENYLLSDELDSALNAYQRGEKVEPSNPLFSIGHAKLNLDKYSIAERKKIAEFDSLDAVKAQQEFDKSAKTAQDQAKLGEAKAKAGESKAILATAIALVKEAGILIDQALLKAGPKNSQVLVEAADAYIHFKNKDLDKAKSYLDKAWALDSKNVEIQILFGDIYSLLSNGTLAADYYNRAMDMDKTNAKPIVSKGRLYARSGNQEGAAEEYKNAIKVNPNYAPAHRELGETYIKLNKKDLAKEELKKYLELSSNNFSARVQYASFLYSGKDYQGAINEAQQAGQKGDKNNATLLRIIMYSYYELKDSAKALEAAQNLFSKLKEEKLVARDYEFYAKVLVQNSRDSAAAEMFRKAYALDNSRTDLLNEAWKSYDKLKKNAEAAAVLKEKIKNGRGVSTTDYFNMGKSYVYAKDYLNADTAFDNLNKKVEEKKQTYPSGYLWRARVNSYIDSTDERSQAKPYYEKYIEVAMADTAGVSAGKYTSGIVEAYQYLASNAFLKQKDRQKAKDYIRKGLELDPSNEKLQEIMRGFEFQEKQEREKREKGSGGNKN
jgi:tetratricopeptide (TPR) repeat protein